MEEPEQIKLIRERYESNDHLTNYFLRDLEAARNDALKAIKKYKHYRDELRKDEIEKKKVLDYFNYIEELKNK